MDKMFAAEIDEFRSGVLKIKVKEILDIMGVYHKATQLTEKTKMDITDQVKFAIAVTDFAGIILQSGEAGEVLFEVIEEEHNYHIQATICPNPGSSLQETLPLFKTKCEYIKNQLIQKNYVEGLDIHYTNSELVIRITKQIPEKFTKESYSELQDFIKNLQTSDITSSYAALRKQGELLIEYAQECNTKKEEAEAQVKEINRLNEQLLESLDTITETKSKAESLTRKNTELDEYSYIVTHDLKAPVRAVNSLVDFIIEDYATTLPEDVQKQLLMIKQSMTNMHDFIQEVLAYSKAGRDCHEKEDVDIQDCLMETLDAISVPSGIKIEINIDKSINKIKCEKIYLVQVFQNLIDNAVKFMDKKEGWIKITCEKENEKFIRFTISDNGPGISDKQIKKIFKLFHTAGKEKLGSTGLGLSIVKKIIEEKGGEITVSSKPNEPTEFTFTWPVE